MKQKSWNRGWSGSAVRLSVILMYVVAWVTAISNFQKLLPFLTVFEKILNSHVVELLAIDLVSTLVIYAFRYTKCFKSIGSVKNFSIIMNNSSCYDPYWSILPPLLMVYEGQKSESVKGTRLTLIYLVFFAWGSRLTYNWFRTFDTWTHQDWRYIDLRKKVCKKLPKILELPVYWIVLSLGGFHLYPTTAVFMGMIPAFDG